MAQISAGYDLCDLCILVRMKLLNLFTKWVNVLQLHLRNENVKALFYKADQCVFIFMLNTTNLVLNFSSGYKSILSN